MSSGCFELAFFIFCALVLVVLRVLSDVARDYHGPYNRLNEILDDMHEDQPLDFSANPDDTFTERK